MLGAYWQCVNVFFWFHPRCFLRFWSGSVQYFERVSTMFLMFPVADTQMSLPLVREKLNEVDGVRYDF
ncbi:hypothetical protein GCM10007094_15880 [Pseudovibrio japonicus]|uniref:Uncharacterized protein n=1 Tax=Pseudovibrio japonicus TaxID=366534 RepID=A0ABQ3E8F6_9HYPH|nr:hypothetical protein GCM10007094_15880 [Pseudovibrio japonicus]